MSILLMLNVESLSAYNISFHMTIMRTKMIQNGKRIATFWFASPFGEYTNPFPGSLVLWKEYQIWSQMT